MHIWGKSKKTYYNIVHAIGSIMDLAYALNNVGPSEKRGDLDIFHISVDTSSDIQSAIISFDDSVESGGLFDLH